MWVVKIKKLAYSDNYGNIFSLKHFILFKKLLTSTCGAHNVFRDLCRRQRQIDLYDKQSKQTRTINAEDSDIEIILISTYFWHTTSVD